MDNAYVLGYHYKPLMIVFVEEVATLPNEFLFESLISRIVNLVVFISDFLFSKLLIFDISAHEKILILFVFYKNL